MIGRTLAHYEITAQLGKGGMGEVYRARDGKLDRDVALKILPQEMSGDPERKARFEREARSLASLQHPNVASIYGFEEADGVRFLVMELVEGEDLAHRLEAGAIAPDEARDIARQLAAGLEAAHDNGLVHRDLKPANVMVGPEGEVKILDFGLARAWFGEVGEDADPSMSPTITAAMTQAGTILGTAAYMSPEQARGRRVDRRADIWAFGVIAYEMLAGRRLFEGDTISDTLAAVLRAEPEWSALPEEQAPELCHLARRCLQRDPRQRLRDIGEARLMLEPGGAALSQLSMSAVPDLPVAGCRRWPLLAAIAVLALVVGAVAGMLWLAPGENAPAIHALIAPPPGQSFHMHSTAPTMAVPSPDGRMIVFGAEGGEHDVLLYLRHVDQGEATVLSGTEDAAYPFWSPDGEYVGFFDVEGNRLRKISVRGGPATTLCTAPNGKGGTWNRDGTIVFAPSHDQPLHRVSATGGDPEPVTELTEGIDSHRHPRFLPDGRQFIFVGRPADGSNAYRVMLGSLDGGEPRELTRSEAQAEYSAGHVLFAREGVLIGAKLDLGAGALVGGSIPLVEGIQEVGETSAAGPYAVNDAGMLLYMTGNFSSEGFIRAITLANGSATLVGEGGRLGKPRVSPDGRLAAVEIATEAEEGVDLWTVDLETGLRNRFTFVPGSEVFPEFTPDGSAVVYAHNTEAGTQIILQPVEGSSGAEVLLEPSIAMRPTGFSPDGKTLLLDGSTAENGFDVFRYELGSGGEPEVLVSGADLEAGARFSPDGRWIAYFSNSDSDLNVYVMPATGSSRKWQVTREGGVWHRWHPDGQHLLYSRFDGSVWSVPVDGQGDTFRVRAETRVAEVSQPGPTGPAFDISPDGTTIYTETPDPDADQGLSLLHMITDWPRALTR